MSPLLPKSIKPTGHGTFTATWYVNRKRRKKTFSSPRLAEDWLARKRLEKEKDEVYGRDNKILISDLFDDYQREKKKSGTSLERDSYIIPRWIAWLANNRIKFVSHLRKSHIAEYETWRAKRSEVGQRTINIDIKLLDAVLNHAWKHDRIIYNPIAKYPYKNDTKPFTRFLTIAEITDLLTIAVEYKIYPMIYAMLTLGLRSEEACYLQFSDYSNGVIHLRPKKIWQMEGNKKITKFWAPKWGRERWICLDQEYANDPYLIELFSRGKDGKYCFLHPDHTDGRSLDRDSLYGKFCLIARDAGINKKNDDLEHVTVHTLRHTHVSYMVARIGSDKKITLRTIMDNVGINDYRTLLRYSQAVKNLSKNLPDPTRFPWQQQ